MDEKKSYLINMRLEVMTNDGETVNTIHIHGIDNEPVPLLLWCDFLERLGKMTPDENVLFVCTDGRIELRPLVEDGKGYVITKNDGVFVTGDYFEGIGDFELKHCRSGQVIRMNRDTMKDFLCVGDYDKSMAEPISSDWVQMIKN